MGFGGSQLGGLLGAKPAGLFDPAIRDYVEGRLKADEFVRTVTLLDRVDVLPKIRIDEVLSREGD